jgi:leader peptidase (prepilin peptidase)/N-methyltransferase
LNGNPIVPDLLRRGPESANPDGDRTERGFPKARACGDDLLDCGLLESGPARPPLHHPSVLPTSRPRGVTAGLRSPHALSFDPSRVFVMTSNDLRLAAIVLVAGIFGLLVGSFLNVIVYRTPRRLSIAGPRSFCPTCHHQLTWQENVPVVSWLALRGRCRLCRQPISVRYPLVEIGTAAAFSLVTWGWRGSLVSVGFCALAATMIAVGLIEYDRTRAPLAVAAVGTGIALLLLLAAAGWYGHFRIVVGAAIGTAIAFGVLSFLRARDPTCADPRGHGRTALLIVGCWCGGLGVLATAIGAATWIAAFLLCMEGARWSAGDRRRGLPLRPTVYALFGTPLILSLSIAMAVSFIAGV